MGLIITPEYKISITGTSIFVTDKTGQYDVTTNPGGWGAPNEELAESCLVVVVVRKASGGDELFEPISPTVAYLYDNSATNADEKEFEIKWAADGVIDVGIIRLPVSLDDTNYVDTGTIQEGDFYFYNNAVRERVSGIGEVFTDYGSLLDEGALLKGVCSDIATPALAIQTQSLYKEYRLSRETDCDDAEELLQEIVKLNTDIQGAYYTFYSNLAVEAQAQVEDLLDKYELKPNE